MNILIAQPKLEKELIQLEHELRSHPEADIAIFPEGYLNHNIDLACSLAKRYGTIIVSGHKRPKDRFVIIDRNGEILADRAKYEPSEITTVDDLKIGAMLCDELVLKGMCGIEPAPLSFIAHPIGVGMFSEEQYEEWIGEAKRIAAAYRTLVIGTSHADGSFRGSDVSIPIAYCISETGEPLLLSASDTRTRILNLMTRQILTV